MSYTGEKRHNFSKICAGGLDNMEKVRTKMLIESGMKNDCSEKTCVTNGRKQ